MFDTLVESRPNPLGVPRWGMVAALGVHIAAIGVMLRPRVPGIPETPIVLVDDLPTPLPAPAPGGIPASLAPPGPIGPLPPLPIFGPIVGVPIPDAVMPGGGPVGMTVDPWRTSGSEPVPDSMVAERPELLAAPQPAYPPRLRDAGVEGVIIVQVVVDTLGRAETASARIVQHGEPGFEKSAIAAILRAQFRPARAWGRAVPALVQVPVAFRIRP
jgi:TonB family protein